MKKALEHEVVGSGDTKVIVWNDWVLKTKGNYDRSLMEREYMDFKSCFIVL